MAGCCPRTAAMGVRIPSSPRSRFASVADQLGTRLQPATTRCDSGQMLDTVDGPARPRTTPRRPGAPGGHAPLVRERGGFDSLGRLHVTSRPRARMRPGSPKPGEVVRFHPAAPRPRRPAVRIPAFQPGEAGSTPAVGTAPPSPRNARRRRSLGGVCVPDRSSGRVPSI